MVQAIRNSQSNFFPTNREEMDSLGWDFPDILFISGDAYIDHPSFGIPLLSRWLYAHGFTVAIVSQPSIQDRDAALSLLKSIGKPKFFCGISAGAIDSMLAHYTAFRKKRHDDAYTPGGVAGARPNRATIFYTSLVRQAFSNVPVVLGGIEASLRRISHYDFWDNSIRRSVLIDSKADLLVYGMGERALLSIAEKAKGLFRDNGVVGRKALVQSCENISGIAYTTNIPNQLPEKVEDLFSSKGNVELIFLPSHEDIESTPFNLMKATLASERHIHEGSSVLVQQSGSKFVIIQPPALALSQKELDTLYGLPFTRMPHYGYKQPVPAWETIRTSITTHRGCGGGCSFCSIALHQGRYIASRSKKSILEEAVRIGTTLYQQNGNNSPRWAGSISDVGGPTANMWQAKCARKSKHCERSSCLHPSVCSFFEVDQMSGVRMLREVRSLSGIRNVRVASGVRFDLALHDREALLGYTSEFTGGQLKVAPEHSCNEILKLMRKPSITVFEQFLQTFFADSANVGKEQYTIPYLMSAFPGSTIQHMETLKKWLQQKNWQPKQVQCFIPTPGTIATAMYYSSSTPDGKPLYVPKSDKERLQQHHILIGSNDSLRKKEKKTKGSYAKKRQERRRS